MPNDKSQTTNKYKTLEEKASEVWDEVNASTKEQGIAEIISAMRWAIQEACNG